MPLSEYKESVGGGLKLKGVKDGGVKKHKKKKAKVPKEDTVPNIDGNEVKVQDEDKAAPVDNDQEVTKPIREESREKNKYGKTEAQLRHEEKQRQRTEERMQREGVKTHKEKVEELNKYLSRLSEHHDMPRIGPG